MRRLPLVPLLLVTLLFLPSKAAAITLQEVVDLTRAGIGEDVLLALIEIDRRVFPIDPETLRMLKASGVSERVIVAIVKSGRTPPRELEQPPVDVPQDVEVPREPRVIIVERERPAVREVVVPVPVYVPVTVRRHRNVEPRKPVEPVYWGWGGKLRPDAWKPVEPPPQPPKKDQR